MVCAHGRDFGFRSSSSNSKKQIQQVTKSSSMLNGLVFFADDADAASAIFKAVANVAETYLKI